MGFVVYCKNEVVWSPSLAVSNYFAENIKSLEKLLKSESGVSFPLSDSIEIDSLKLNEFVDKILEFVELTNNTPLLIMISGICEIVVALNSRLNGTAPRITSKNRSIIEKSKKVFHPIADYIN